MPGRGHPRGPPGPASTRASTAASCGAPPLLLEDAPDEAPDDELVEEPPLLPAPELAPDDEPPLLEIVTPASFVAGGVPLSVEQAGWPATAPPMPRAANAAITLLEECACVGSMGARP
jgi:hypothetical protein